MCRLAIHRFRPRFKRIAQKDMAHAAFDAYQCSPNRVLERKLLLGNQAGTLNRIVTASELGRERQEISAVLPIVEYLKWLERAHLDTPQIVKNSARSAAL